MQNDNHIQSSSIVADIVRHDYRTAAVLQQYGIEYCCAGRFSLGDICDYKKIEFGEVAKALENATRRISIPSCLAFDNWETGFLIDYIINIHHAYLSKILPSTSEQLRELVNGHQKKYSYLNDLYSAFNELCREINAHIKHEEEIIFPYIKQIDRAFHSKESYASLLVRTLRKPVENLSQHQHNSINRILKTIRDLTSHYQIPGKACINHTVVFSVLKEIDEDLTLHMQLENDIVFPRAVSMEKNLLAR